ncbi:MAG: recombinase family protein, partial [Myxococcales bacterium]|nr:recombinase family protein [Myxococcales bacterium]
VVYKVDRLSRSLLDFAQIMERLNEAGCAFVSVTQNFSTADAMGRLTLNMLMSFAEFEREMISERTRDKIAASRRRGKWTGGPTPYGFRLVAGRLEPIDEEAEVVREIYRLYEEHRSALAVAQTLNRSGVEGRKRDRGAKRKDRQGLWCKDRVLRVLRSPVYCGRMPYKGEVHDGEHDALIEPARWEALQVMLDEHVMVTTAWGQNPDYLLRGLLRCGACGRAMSPSSTRSRGREFRYYRCGTQSDEGSDACSGRPLPAAQVEDYVVQKISAAVADPSLVAEVEAATRTRLESERRRLRATERELRSRIAAEADSAREDDENRLAAVLQTLAELDEAEVSSGWVASVLRDFDRVWEVLTPPNRVRLVQSLVDHVLIDATTGSIEIELADPSSHFPLHRSQGQ